MSNLGMPRNQIVLVPHNPEWTILFEAEAATIRDILKEELVEIEHVGSTAIPGIVAKPIIDISVNVRNTEAIGPFRSCFENHDYEWKGEYGIPGRRYLVKYNADKSVSYFHLHIVSSGHGDLERNRSFRNFLRKNISVAKEYEKLKVDLLEKFENDRELYTNNKSVFIQRVLKRATYSRL